MHQAGGNPCTSASALRAESAPRGGPRAEGPTPGKGRASPAPEGRPRSPVAVGAEALALPQHRAVQVQHLRAAGRRHLERNTPLFFFFLIAPFVYVILSRR